MGSWYLYLYLPLPPWNIKWWRWSVGHPFRTVRHQQKSIWPGQALTPCHVGSEGSFPLLSALPVLQLCPITRQLLTSPQGLLVCSGAPCTHPALSPSTRLRGSLVDSVFCFQASYSDYSSENNIMCLLSYWFWLWELRWDQHLSSCELSPAKTLCIILQVLCLLPTPLKQQGRLKSGFAPVVCGATLKSDQFRI